jgi:hypothetical protein
MVRYDFQLRKFRDKLKETLAICRLESIKLRLLTDKLQRVDSAPYLTDSLR